MEVRDEIRRRRRTKTKLKLWEATKSWSHSSRISVNRRCELIEQDESAVLQIIRTRKVQKLGLSAERFEADGECRYGESRGEPYDGQVAVAAVILNRVKSPSFPEHGFRCYFSAWCIHSGSRRPDLANTK